MPRRRPPVRPLTTRTRETLRHAQASTMSAEQPEEPVAEPQPEEPKGLLQPPRVGIYACLRSDYDPAAAEASFVPPPPPPAAEEEESASSADVDAALDDVDAALDVEDALADDDELGEDE